jgi:hypothetical protein
MMGRVEVEARIADTEWRYGLIVPPVLLWDPEAGDLLAFASAEAAAAHLAPWQEVGAVVAYDAEGRRVAFAVERRRMRLLRIFPVAREVVVVGEVESAPGHASDLRRALVAALVRRGGDRAALEALALAELVERCQATAAPA